MAGQERSAQSGASCVNPLQDVDVYEHHDGVRSEGGLTHRASSPTSWGSWQADLEHMDNRHHYKTGLI